VTEEKHQDYIYINENYYKDPKESFLFIHKIINENHHVPSVLDLGCARGEFLYYLKNNIEYERLAGIDYSYKLINEAKKFDGLNGVEFEVGSADNFNLNSKFDVVVMSGVLSYFNDIYKVFECMKNHLKSGGKIIIFGFFNEYDVDLLVKYRNNKFFDTFESGWNIHSINTISKELKKLDLAIVNQEVFELSFKSRKQDDPCRAWNIETEEGIKFTNGLKLLYDMSALEIAEAK
jgi:SAM-dependent methyltransferase